MGFYQYPDKKDKVIKSMSFYGTNLQILVASVARSAGLIPRNNHEADILLKRFFKGEKLPYNFMGPKKEEMIEEGQPENINKEVNPVPWSPTSADSPSDDNAYDDEEIEKIHKNDQVSNANLESFKNLLTFDTMSKAVFYLADIPKASLDSKVFLCNRDNAILQDVFNLPEIKPAKFMRHFTLDSCETATKFYLPPNLFKQSFRLMKKGPISFVEDGNMYMAFKDLVNEHLMYENPVYIMVRLLLDRKLKGFWKKLERLEEIRRVRLIESGKNKQGFFTAGASQILSQVSSFFWGSKAKSPDKVPSPMNQAEVANAGEVNEEPDNSFKLEEEEALKDEVSELTSKSSKEKKEKQPYQGPTRRLKINYDAHQEYLEEFSYDWLSDDEKLHFETIMIHIHGGGFMAMTSSSHQVYLRKWAKQLKIPIFSVEYRLAPQTQFPFVLNDCIRTYIWILGFLEHVMKCNVKKIIIAGDSAGGNLAIAVSTWCIEQGIRVPDVLHLHYPAVSLNRFQFTPSFIYSMDDYFLNFSVLKCSIEVYVPPYINAARSYYVSPIKTPPSILAKFPAVECFVCERDPLRDDDLRFALKLLKLGVKCKVYYFKYTTHGVLNLSMKFGLPAGQTFESFVRESLQKLLYKYDPAKH